eukprot:CAMPEP_0116004614 /NCGR_PEP_ID=MMETSP0321-20121206/699_1 /TAXON_ID=163516 /ORGANISM="Leptocylindrus danicus var. danicus, Strain B650" /LENGTH=187 /DNA_ID=CAMNT_0003472933 /DNA_START=90 /DNA_END=654 /DNA_ORIENTATION=-
MFLYHPDHLLLQGFPFLAEDTHTSSTGGYNNNNHQHQYQFRSLNGVDLSERARREKEQKEEQMSADELRKVLKKERALSARLAVDLIALRDSAAASAIEAEADEEFRINNLMRRLECLHKEKGKIVLELEREEEMLTNNLMRRLSELKREKQMLEHQIGIDHPRLDDSSQSQLIGRPISGGSGSSEL